MSRSTSVRMSERASVSWTDRARVVTRVQSDSSQRRTSCERGRGALAFGLRAPGRGRLGDDRDAGDVREHLAKAGMVLLGAVAEHEHAHEAHGRATKLLEHPIDSSGAVGGVELHVRHRERGGSRGGCRPTALADVLEHGERAWDAGDVVSGGLKPPDQVSLVASFHAASRRGTV